MKNLKIEMSKKNFDLATGSLFEFLQLAQDRNLDRSGVIKAFEFSFETTWKLLQKIFEFDGESVGSPRDAFKFAFRNKLISPSQEQTWLNMIDDRNLTVHTYDVDLSRKIFKSIKENYGPAFLEIKAHLESKYG